MCIIDRYSVVDLGRQAVMECCRHTVSVEMPERSVRPAVLVIPGGGYSYKMCIRDRYPFVQKFYVKGVMIGAVKGLSLIHI